MANIKHCSPGGGEYSQPVFNTVPQMEENIRRPVFTTVPQVEEVINRLVFTSVP